MESQHDGRRRRLPAAERREVILDAAIGLFASRGYHAAAMEEIASAAGISKAVVYDHFVSKQELYTQLLERIRGDLDAVVEASLAPVEAEGEPRVRAAIDAFFGYVEEHADASRLLFLELQGTAEAAEIVRALELRVTEGLTATLGENALLFEGHVERERQLRILAELLKSAIHGLASWWYRYPEVPRVDLVDRTVALVWPAIERAGGGAVTHT
ncbi:MAG: transcriptional regulator, TetR family [Conexibacter sp.]|nr:transcriptional regulator, TetR family [Conexibacter sp.]